MATEPLTSITNTLAANEVRLGYGTGQFVQGFGASVMGSDDTYDVSLVDVDSDGYPVFTARTLETKTTRCSLAGKTIAHQVGRQGH